VVKVAGGDETMTRVVVEHPGAVVVLAVDEQERVLVLRQYRHPARLRFVEFPAGLLDKPGEDPLVAARRELLEEGAIEAEEWTHLNTVHSSPGFSDERVEVYLARGLRSVPDRGGFVLEHEEADMTLHWVPVAELLEAALARRWTDGSGLVGLLTYALTHGTPLPGGGARGA
jgi:8-oxo-dGTP pyrophosphatase MutT (NUDIX family)